MLTFPLQEKFKSQVSTHLGLSEPQCGRPHVPACLLGPFPREVGSGVAALVPVTLVSCSRGPAHCSLPGVGCWGPSPNLQHQTGQAWPGLTPADALSSRDSRSASPRVLRESSGSSFGLAQSSKQSESPLPVLRQLQVRSPQIPVTHRSNPDVELLSVNVPCLPRSGQPVTTSSSSVWTPNLPGELPAGSVCKPLCSLHQPWLCSPVSLSQLGPIQSSLEGEEHVHEGQKL